MDNLFPKKIKSRAERIAWLSKNSQFVIDCKKSAIKVADPIGCAFTLLNDNGVAIKNLSELKPKSVDRIKVRAVINTTKLLDSHMDVHIDQLWNKSLKENRKNYLVREHNFTFDGIISDDVHAFVKQMTWNELGFSFPGNTQALIYDAVINRSDNPYMFEKYLENKVPNHSVAMRYIKVHLAVNDPQYPEYENWEKYYPVIVNPEMADNAGYFFAVTEAKNIEGSAVVAGSNFATPTLSVEEKSEPVVATHKKEPIKVTPQELLKYYRLRI
jgi:hypothetical protein